MGLDAVAIDLNTLIDPASGWTLTEANGISDTNWVTGIGSFDPDGGGPLAAYDRAFLLDVSPRFPSRPPLPCSPSRSPRCSVVATSLAPAVNCAISLPGHLTRTSRSHARCASRPV